MAAHFIVHIASGEWMLRGRVNGGTIIFFRSMQVALTVWLLAVWFRSICYAAWPWRFGGLQVLHDLGEHLPWLGAVFGAVYVALYAKFSSQWSYLAQTYNQLMSTQAMIQNPNENTKIIAWKAGFIEDAQDLHLATKPMFAMAIWYMLQDQRISDEFDLGTKGGAKRRSKLQDLLKKAIGEDNLPPLDLRANDSPKPTLLPHKIRRFSRGWVAFCWTLGSDASNRQLQPPPGSSI